MSLAVIFLIGEYLAKLLARSGCLQHFVRLAQSCRNVKNSSDILSMEIKTAVVNCCYTDFNFI